MSRWRHSFYKLVPSWLSTGQGEVVLYSLGKITDAFIERTRRSLVARFPTYTGPTALNMLGDERGIVRGRAEDRDGYARRLREWRGVRGHLVRGNAFAALRQVWNYFDDMPCETIDPRGNHYFVAADGTETVTHGGSWTWDSSSASNWWRFWIVLKPTAAHGVLPWGDFGTADLWGGNVSVAGTTIGQTGIAAGDVNVMRNLFTGERPWKMAGTRAEWAVVSLDGTSPVPDSTWGKWYKIVSNVAVESRSTAYRYWALNVARNTWTGDAEVFAPTVTLVDATTSSGNPDNAAAWGAITLPDNSTYAGNSATFPTPVQLPDDGDLPQW